MFRRFKRSWFLSNNHYLLPVFIVLFLVNSFIAGAGLLVVLFVYLMNIMRARLPIDPGGDAEAETFIYKTAGGVKLKLDLWRPDSCREGGNVLIVFAHGGGWVSGFRNQPKNISWCRFLSSRGFTVASIDYRLAFKYSMDDILEDYSDAVSFLRSRCREVEISCSNIILMGLSAGGHLALSYAAFNTAGGRTDSMNGIRGVVAYYSPSDLRDLFSPDDKSVFARFGAGSALKTLPAFDEEAFRRYSPVSWFTTQMVPVMAVHGRKDEIVPYASSVKMIKRLKELGVPCRFLVHNTGGHGFEVISKDLRTTRILEETVGFIRNLAENQNKK